MKEEGTIGPLDFGDLSQREITLLLAYRSAPAWKKERMTALASLMARVMRPEDPDQLYDQVSRLFAAAPPSRPLGSIMREAWECIHRARATPASK
jgi:hypothetical protein